MGRILHITLVSTAMALLIVSCSGGEGMPGVTPPVIPDIMPPQAAATVDVGRYLLGFWDVWISEDRSTFEVTPVRGVQVHFNVLNILEKVCTNCLIIKNVKVLPTGELSADLMLRHPFPGQVRNTGFDVRGILIADSDYEFPESGRRIAIGGSCLRLVNADGYTSLFNPTEFPVNPELPYLLQYTKGKYSQGEGPFDATLNPYLAYSKDKPRRMFAVGTSETHTVILDPPAGELQFGYAVDASWVYVNGPITDPVTDFPPQANCIEAYEISVTAGEVSEQTGGKGPVEVWAYDHQGATTIASVTVEVPDVFPGEFTLNYTGDAPDGAAIFTGWAPNTFAAPEGEYRMLIRVIDTATDPNLGPIDAWQLSHIPVAPPLPGWARTWGGEEDNSGRGVAVDESGNIYVTGSFKGTVDFDPGTGEDYHTEGGYNNAYLCKFNPEGDFQWARTWGALTESGNAGPRSVGTYLSGSVYVTGRFNSTVDFDPGSGEDLHQSTSEDYDDVFVSKFDVDGNFLWVRVWGGTADEEPRDLTVDNSGNIYMTGRFAGTVDFDPGDGIDEHVSHNDNRDVFLSGLDSEGVFLWARTWGGEMQSEGRGVAVDGLGNIFVTGGFSGIVDFDPGPGEDIQTSDSYSPFLSKFDDTGGFLWARTWATNPEGSGESRDLAVNSSGDSFITGTHHGTADYDPGVGEDIHSSNKNAMFLTSLNPDGDFRWARTWGDNPSAAGWGVAYHESGTIYISGHFTGLDQDFDPGPGEDLHSAYNYMDTDSFLSKFNYTGDFIWARTWGGPTFGDYGRDVAVNNSQTAYVIGNFDGPCDFDPGPGEDIREGYADIFLLKILHDGYW